MDDRAQATGEIEELRRQLSFIKALPDNSPMGLFVVDHRKDIICYFNEAFIEMWSADHLKDRLARGEADCDEVLAHLAGQVDDPEAFTALCRHIRSSDELKIRECMLKLPNDRHVSFSTSQIFDSDGHYYGRMYAFEEVTRIVKAEENVRKSDEQYRELADLLPQIVFEIDLAGNLTFVNRSAYDLMGFSHQKSPLGLNVLTMVAPEDRERARQNIRQVLNGEKSGFEYTFMRFDGSRFPVRAHSAVILRNGKPAGLRGFIVDVSEQKAAEARLQRLSAAIEQSPGSVMIFDPEGTVVYVNPQYSRITGYAPEDTVGKSLFGLSYANARPEQLDEIASAIRAGHEWRGEIEYKARSGRSSWVSAHIFPIRDAGGMITHFIDVEEDITERKIADHERQKLLMALDQSPNSITIADNSGRITYVNSAFTRLTGIRSEEVVGNRKVDLARKAIPQEKIGSILAAATSGQNWKNESHVVRKAGGDLWISVNISPIRDAGGKVEYLVIVEEDITERKQAEEKLLLTQTSIDHFHDPCTWADEEGQFLYVNDAACQLYGYSREELLNMRITDLELYYTDDKFKEIYNRIKTLGSAHFESLNKARDGRIFPVEISTKYHRYGDKEYIITFLRDITERKQAEEKLHLTQASIDNFHDPCTWSDEDGLILYVNDAACQALGYSRDELLRMNIQDIDPHYQEEQYQEIFRRLKAQGATHFESVHRAKDGTVFPIEISTKIVRFGDRDIAVSIERNITERKKAEAELRKLSVAVEQSPASVRIVGVDARIIYVNPKFTEMSGYRPEEVIGKHTREAPAGLNTGDILQSIIQTIKACKSWHGELQYLKKSGQPYWVRSQISPIRDETGKIQHYIEISEDITEQKLTESKLADNLRFLQTLIDTIPVPVFYKNKQGAYIGCNSAFEQYVGKSREQIIGKTVYDINPVETADMFHRADEKLLQSGSVQTYENGVVHADGSIHQAVFYKAPFYNPDGTLGGLIGTMLDITERKHIEEQLRGSLREKEVLLKEVHHRVKNNMQIISSLLSLQLSGVDQEPVRQILEESQNRIRSIALVHERLYKSSDLSRIDFSEYLKSMGNQLLITYMSTSGRVKIKVEGAGVLLGVDQAVPCGLILNELISNSLKHAFPGSTPGEVQIHLRSDGGRQEIIVEDNGVGLPKDFSLDNVQSMGMQLVSALVEQLEGTITFARTPGARFTITFPAK